MQASACPVISTRPRRHTERVPMDNRSRPRCAVDGAADETVAPAPTTAISLSHRDLAVLRAVAAGRCQMPEPRDCSLTVDGLCCCDQFVGPRLASAGLIASAGPRPGPARLTPSGRALLDVA
jgi:hypothetical protein